MSFTPYNAPLLSGLLGDLEVAAHFSVKAEIETMLKFESALASAQAKVGLIARSDASKIVEICESFEPELAALQAGVIRDGMAVPEFVRQLRFACGGEVGTSVHFGATSQDVVDTSLVLRLKEVNGIFRARIETLIKNLSELESKFGANDLKARTRMQVALPVRVGHRIGQWRQPIETLLASLVNVEERLFALQLGGPVGDLAKMGEKGVEVRKILSSSLNLVDPKATWHTDRSRIINYCNWLTELCSALGKIGTDAALMAQNEINELKTEGAGTSSAMAHKQNPVLAEILVTLARFSATLNAGMQHNMIHEQERSGIAWTHEWMIIPQICVATGATLRNANSLITSIVSMGDG